MEALEEERLKDSSPKTPQNGRSARDKERISRAGTTGAKGRESIVPRDPRVTL